MIAPMSTSYKAVFVLSIVMIFVVIIGGAMSGSKSVGFAVWYWGYTAWKMYKRDNDSLVSLQQGMLWFEAIAFSIGLAVLLFSDSDVRRYVDITPIGFIILAFISMGVTYLLYQFFKGQKNISSASALIGSNSSIDDRFWEQASRELEGDRHEATWARAIANAEGDEPKAKAMYLKLRSANLQISSFATKDVSPNNQIVSSSSLASEAKLFWSSFNGIGKAAIVGIILLVSYSVYDSYIADKSRHILISSSSNGVGRSVEHESYDQCVSFVLKKGSNGNLLEAQSYCQELYPKLATLIKGSSVKLSCLDSNGKTFYNFSISNDSVKLSVLENVAFTVSSRTKTGLYFKAESVEKDTNRSVIIYGKIDPVRSNGTMTVEYKDKKTSDYIYEFTCSEESR
jgi:hypothetical protein